VDIAVEHVARRYGRRWALVDVSLKVSSGEVLMVAGHNGSGKSTLFRVLSTIIRPDGGTATVGGLDVVHDRDRIRQSLALLSHASYLYESLTARENLAVVARFLGKKDVMTSLERVGLASRADDPVSTFSAGMRKRVSFARIFLQEPEVVLLDEPYGQLDPAGFALVDEVVRELKSRGATVLMATHQVGHVAAVADRALLLEQGRVTWNGPAGELPE
jgi:heme exporter protein A